MSSHSIKFLDLRRCPQANRFDRLEEEVKLLSNDQTLIVVLSFNPLPYFEDIADSDLLEGKQEYCFNDYQVTPEVCVGSITPTTASHETDRAPVSSETYSSIFAGLPMDME